ncbi:MAG: hypothetical protein HYW85_02360 [Deltaproteobacteria bacterium]|nr:hypothetical protein [Deltaproteobacteria bacterium]
MWNKVVRVRKLLRVIDPKLIFFGLIIWNPVFALELKQTETQDRTPFFETVYEAVGPLEYEIIGASILEKAQKKSENAFLWKPPKGVKVKKAYLVWSGYVAEAVIEKGAKNIALTFPEGRKLLKMTPDRFYTVEEEGSSTQGQQKAYTGVVDVTSVLKKEGIYKVGDAETQADRFGGYGVIAIYENPKVPKRYVGIQAGMARLKPGEIYKVQILKENKVQGQVGGGNAISGNGSSNLLNGVTLTGKDDWDSSSGWRWDIDHFEIGKFQIESQKGLTWSIDPLLQWLYPVAAVIQIDIRVADPRSKKGGEKR